MDTTVLSRLWDHRWPGHSKVPYGLRGIEDRWVRFHALPESKRYPTTEAEYEVVLARHNTVLAELIGNERNVLVVTVGYSERPQPEEPGRSPETVAVQPDGMYWTSEMMDDEPGCEQWMHLYVNETRWAVGCLDPLLRRVADDVVANVLIADHALRWLYHPYDGGMDVILPSMYERDAIRDRHSRWLSSHPAGL